MLAKRTLFPYRSGIDSGKLRLSAGQSPICRSTLIGKEIGLRNQESGFESLLRYMKHRRWLRKRFRLRKFLVETVPKQYTMILWEKESKKAQKVTKNNYFCRSNE